MENDRRAAAESLPCIQCNEKMIGIRSYEIREVCYECAKPGEDEDAEI